MFSQARQRHAGVRRFNGTLPRCAHSTHRRPRIADRALRCSLQPEGTAMPSPVPAGPQANPLPRLQPNPLRGFLKMIDWRLVAAVALPLWAFLLGVVVTRKPRSEEHTSELQSR